MLHLLLDSAVRAFRAAFFAICNLEMEYIHLHCHLITFNLT